MTVGGNLPQRKMLRSPYGQESQSNVTDKAKQRKRLLSSGDQFKQSRKETGRETEESH